MGYYRSSNGARYVKCENGQMRRISGSDRFGWSFTNCGVKHRL